MDLLGPAVVAAAVPGRMARSGPSAVMYAEREKSSASSQKVPSGAMGV